MQSCPSAFLFIECLLNSTPASIPPFSAPSPENFLHIKSQNRSYLSDNKIIIINCQRQSKLDDLTQSGDSGMMTAAAAACQAWNALFTVLQFTPFDLTARCLKCIPTCQSVFLDISELRRSVLLRRSTGCGRNGPGRYQRCAWVSSLEMELVDNSLRGLWSISRTVVIPCL